MFNIYKITNKTNNKSYIGYTKQSIEDRFQQHCSNIRSNKRMPIHNAIKKYGVNSFEIECLHQFDNKKQAVQKEIELIETLSPEYNAHTGGTGGAFYGEQNGMYGRKHSQQHKKFMSITMSGEKNPMYGKTHTKEAREKISKSAIGRKVWNKGKVGVYSEETLKKMRRPKSEDHIQKLRKSYLIDGELCDNIKQWCKENGHNYVVATQCAKNGKPYKKMIIEQL